MPPLVDISGKRFGSLVVLRRNGTNKGGYPTWECRCDCGKIVTRVRTTLLAKGGTKSCGCLRKFSRSIDITGSIFGKLTAISISHSDNKNTYWNCLCECGGHTVKPAGELRAGRVWNCGCSPVHRDFVDITGEKIGRLVILGFVNGGRGNPQWLCLCECGNEIIVGNKTLKSGNVKSCGCSSSIGEGLIETFLKENNIAFQREKTFPGCTYVSRLRFDFFLPEMGVAIEFDGEQHFRESGWHDNVPLSVVQKRDAVKDMFCYESDIVLIRIPHYEQKNIETILTKMLQLVA